MMIMLAIYEDDNDDNYDFNDDDAVNDDYGACDNYLNDNEGDDVGVH